MTKKIKLKNDSVSALLRQLGKEVSVHHISSYIPRKCGIATFTKDLTNALNLINPMEKAKIIAMSDESSKNLEYPSEVVGKITEENREEYKKMALKLNSSRTDVVCIQHEFGIYGGKNGEYVLDLAKNLKKPLVTTLHTIMKDEKPELKEIVRDLSANSEYVVVMLDKTKDILNKYYQVEKDKIVVIPHGVPDFPKPNVVHYKEKLGLEGKIVMASINLLDKLKGIEYALKALPNVVDKHPNFLYLVIGETHPATLRAMGGEKYRKKLTKIVDSLNLEKNVRFINEYITLQQIIEFIGASDFYITPYLVQQQSSSGALSYAIGAGKACISTRFIYAKEMLSDNSGILLPFRDSRAVAEAILRLIENPQIKEAVENNAYEKGRKMTWVRVAHQYYHLLKISADTGKRMG